MKLGGGVFDSQVKADRADPRLEHNHLLFSQHVEHKYLFSINLKAPLLYTVHTYN